MHCWIFCSYQSFWDGLVALIACSFGGLVLKSLVVETHKHVYQRPKNGLDDKIHKCCKTFLNNVKAVIFYSVPHVGGTNPYQIISFGNINKSTHWTSMQPQLGFKKI